MSANTIESTDHSVNITYAPWGMSFAAMPNENSVSNFSSNDRRFAFVTSTVIIFESKNFEILNYEQTSYADN